MLLRTLGSVCSGMRGWLSCSFFLFFFTRSLYYRAHILLPVIMLLIMLECMDRIASTRTLWVAIITREFPLTIYRVLDTKFSLPINTHTHTDTLVVEGPCLSLWNYVYWRYSIKPQGLGQSQTKAVRQVWALQAYQTILYHNNNI